MNVQRSMSQLAQQSGHGSPGGPGGAGDDPIQSLDSNSDGSVFSDEVKKLYAAIDSDGALSTDEISGFREKLQAQMGHGQSQPPQESSDSGSTTSSTSSSSSATRSSQRPDASEMIRMIAARYAKKLTVPSEVFEQRQCQPVRAGAADFLLCGSPSRSRRQGISANQQARWPPASSPMPRLSISAKKSLNINDLRVLVVTLKALARWLQTGSSRQVAHICR